MKDPVHSSKEVIRKSGEFLLHTVGWTPIVFAEGSGAILKDIDGKEYIDGVSGTNGPMLIGHSHPRLVEVVQMQAEKLIQHLTCFDNVPSVEVAEKLASLIPPNWGLKKSYFTSGGGEAVETALKLIMKQTRKTEVISLYYSYHGLSLGTMSLSGLPWLRSFIPGGLRWPGFQQIPNAYCYRCYYGLKYPDCGLACARELEYIIKFGSSGNVGAFIIEPIQGPGGHIEFPKDYYQEVRDICDENEVILIADEVQTGLGRCGSLFASQLYDLKPDVLIMGKALGGGLPIGAAVFKEDLTPSELENESWHSLTFQNNPLICAAALTSLNIITEEKLPERAMMLGKRCRKALSDLMDECTIIGDVRGSGLFIGIELVKDRITKEPAIEEAKKAQSKALEKGLIISRGGLGNVLKIKPPLVITNEQIGLILIILEKVLKKT